MKTLLGGIVLIVAIGLLGFFYRNVAENPATPKQQACTMEAKMCPDGSAVGRQGPNCEFSPCLFPNIDMPVAGISFALPEGYAKGVQEPGADGYVEDMLDFYQKVSLSTSTHHYITIYKHTIPEGKTAEDVILANTRFQPADMQAEDMSKFKPVIINGKTFQSVVIERFEAQVMSSYFLARAQDVLRFDVLERDVTDWMEPSLKIDELPQHKALLEMLATLTTI